MTVAELRTILEHLPDELEVHIHASPGPTAHIVGVRRHPTIHSRYPVTLPGSRYTTRVPSHVQLNVGFERVGWWREPPAFWLYGPFRDRRSLNERLVDLGAA